jgi:DNA-binding cell septation regulator SpoVG
MQSGIEITEVKIVKAVKGDGAHVLAIARIVLNGAFAVNGIRIVRGKFGNFVAFPSAYDVKAHKGFMYSHPTTRAAQTLISEKVLAAYLAHDKVESPVEGFTRTNETFLEGSALLEPINTTKARVVELFGEYDDSIDHDEDGLPTYGNPLIVQAKNGEKYSIYTRWGGYRIGGFERGEFFAVLKNALEGVQVIAKNAITEQEVAAG